MKESRGKLIAGFMFIGMGIGWATDHMVAGMFIGLGLGILASELLDRENKN